ncbi:MAG: sulfite exporter TauE/SafE family protein [Ignavibacteriae bacterium]|nr:sulfite exporter TauE/SafE family protein [Ignavibacteriota bacterium]
MDLLALALLLVAGCVTGFLAGFFGVGGGIILVPILLVYFSSIGVSSLVATHVTFGTSLFIVIFASAASAYKYYTNGHVIWRAVAVIGIASIVGAAIGTNLAAGMEGKTLQRIFAAVITVVAFRLMGESKTKEAESVASASPAWLAVTGVIVGLVSSLAGVGGGVFSIPMMHYMLKFPLKKALGTSSATIVITALAATIGYMLKGWDEMTTYAPELAAHTIGYVDYFHSLPVILGMVPLATVGAAAAHKTNVNRLRTLYAIFLIVIAARMFFA